MVIGLTGGVGCGKSTALKTFSTLGWHVIDADAICHQLYDNRNDCLLSALRTRWGDRVFNDQDGVNKAAIADIVFNDQSELKWLNGIIHPLVQTQAADLIDQLNYSWIMFDVPLLFEVDWGGFFQAIVSVWTSPHLQHKRLVLRGWSEKQISARINNQLANDQKVEHADFAIINTGSRKWLIEQCNMINNRIKGI